jgi:hypothetical protein
MKQHLFYEWPARLSTLFDGTALAEKIGFTVSLVTVDADDQLQTSLLSVGELYASGSRTIGIALWPQSRAARALANGARAALTFVDEGTFYQVQLRVKPLPPVPASSPSRGPDDDTIGLACFSAAIQAGEAHRVDYARLTGGITFELEDDGVPGRWEKQIGHLKRSLETAAAGPGDDL